MAGGHAEDKERNGEVEVIACIVVFDMPEPQEFRNSLSGLPSGFRCTTRQSILRTTEFWPGPTVPVCSVTPFDWWIRTDMNGDCMPTNNDIFLLTNNNHLARMRRALHAG
jgi:hypothetical protein